MLSSSVFAFTILEVVWTTLPKKEFHIDTLPDSNYVFSFHIFTLCLSLEPLFYAWERRRSVRFEPGSFASYLQSMSTLPKGASWRNDGKF